MKLNDEIRLILAPSKTSPKLLPGEKTRPRNINAYKKPEPENTRTDEYYMLSTDYAQSPFRFSQSYLRFVVGLDAEDIQLTSKQYSSQFITYAITPGIYSIKDFSDAVYTKGVQKWTLKFVYDDISMETKNNLTPFGGIFGNLRLM